jgi:hypothetical protein
MPMLMTADRPQPRTTRSRLAWDKKISHGPGFDVAQRAVLNSYHLFRFLIGCFPPPLSHERKEKNDGLADLLFDAVTWEGLPGQFTNRT